MLMWQMKRIQLLSRGLQTPEDPQRVCATYSKTCSCNTSSPGQSAWSQISLDCSETKLIFWATRCKNELHRTLPQSWSCLCPCFTAWWDKSSQIARERFCNLFKAKDYLIRASSLIMLWGLTLFGAEGFLLKVHHHPVKAPLHSQTLCYCWGQMGLTLLWQTCSQRLHGWFRWLLTQHVSCYQLYWQT